MRIPDGTFIVSTEFWGRKLNLFLIRGERLFLIDTGLAGMPGDLLFPYMDEHSLKKGDLALFASSHAHADHMGGNAEIKAACPQARLGAHELDRPWIEDHEKLCRDVYDVHPELQLFGPDGRQNMLNVCGADSPVDIAWKGGEVLDLGGRRIEVVHAPGHTPGNLVFLDRENGTLFEAEAILGDSSGEPGKKGVPYFYDVAAYRNTLRHLAELPWNLLLSSHAAPRDRRAGLALIQQSLDFVDQLQEQVRGLLVGHGGPMSFAALLDQMSRVHGWSGDLGLVLLLETSLSYLRRIGEAEALADDRWEAR